MSNTFAVARIDFLLLIRDKRFLLTGLILWIMLGSLLGAVQARFVSDQRELIEAQKVSHRQWQSRSDSSGHALGHYGTYVYRRATPLSMLDPGSEPYFGVAAHIVAHEQTNMFYRPMLDRPAIDRWVNDSAAALLQIVVPLLLLLLAFSSIAGEREEGRLRFLLSQGASPMAFGTGKLLGVATAGLILLLPTTLIVFFLIGQTAMTLGENDDLVARMAILTMGYLAAYIFFLAAGVAISALSPSRQTALLVSVALWALLCLVTPRVLSMAAESRFSTPESDVLKERIDLDRKDRTAGMAIQSRVVASALKKYGVKREEDLPINLDALQLQAGEEWVNGINDKHRGKVWSQFLNQETWVSHIGGFFTPNISLRNLSETVSGTDSITLRDHVAAIENFRRDWVRRLNEADITRKPQGHSTKRGVQESKAVREKQESKAVREKEEREQQAIWASFPPFSHQPPTLTELGSRIFNPLLVLWAWAGLAVSLALFIVHQKSGAKRGNN